jgi:DNA repair protein RecO (recombination protein O)
MTIARTRESLHAAFVLHHRPWRDTSRILEVFTRDHGRLTLFARGVRGARAPLASILLPFQPLLVAWSGRGDAGQLTRAEAVAAPLLPPAAVMPAYYLSELVLRLTTRHDPLPALFDAYAESIEALRGGAEPARPLRLFEKRLLDVLGYGIDLLREARSGEAVQPGRQYHFCPSEGLRVLERETAAAEPALAGRSLLELHAETLADPRSLDDARRVLRAALAPLLEGRELATRAVARSVSGRRRPPRPAGR